MPSLNTLADHVALNIGTFERGKWDYIMLAQLYPTLEALAQLVPRKQAADNYKTTVSFQDETDSPYRGATAGTPVTPGQTQKSLTRTVRLVKNLGEIGWVLDEDKLKGKSDEHIVKQIQMDMVEFDLHWWQDLENSLLNAPGTLTHVDSNPLFGFPAWISDDDDISDDSFNLYGGDDPFVGGRPGSISVDDYRKFTNPVAKFTAVSDYSFFRFVERFLTHRKLMGAVPNPRLLPDTPNDVCYVQYPLHEEITAYLQASNQDTGVNAGRYRGNPAYKSVPFVVWHALGHPDSPVAPTTCQAYLIDWNSFKYSVHPEYDRKIDGPTDVNLVPDGVYMTCQTYHQVTCDRPDRNCKFVSDTADLQPA